VVLVVGVELWVFGEVRNKRKETKRKGKALLLFRNKGILASDSQADKSTSLRENIFISFHTTQIWKQHTQKVKACALTNSLFLPWAQEKRHFCYLYLDPAHFSF
jgi:hypothetical protein